MSVSPLGRILLIGPDTVSHLLCTQALCIQLLAHYPNARIDIVASESLSGLINSIPQIQTHFPLETQNKKLSVKNIFKLVKKLKPEAYQQAIVLTDNYRPALLSWLTRIRSRIGFGSLIRLGLLNDIRTSNAEQYDLLIQRYVSLAYHAHDPDAAQKIPTPKLEVQDDTVKNTCHRYQLHDHKPILIICPGSPLGDTHRWPAKYFAAVANVKLDAGWQVWLIGHNSDQPYAAEIQTRTQKPCIDFTGRLNLEETIALLSIGKQVVTNESEWMHIASVLNKPTIAIYGAHHPSLEPPLSKYTKVVSIEIPCKPCNQRQCPDQHYRCLRDILPETITHHLNLIEKDCTTS